ncbi:LptA/OstA family protein [Belnapia moabensis]|uniref:LptA/OstA family protein n=1 Tax=Belnapia moabensis TaxID=365533 RepID=UPI000A01CA11|nr:LptA/OstA family protein [Belnapia moabensis]
MRRWLLAALLALPLHAMAQGIDMSQGGPVDVTASDGIEWRQAEQVVIARGNARAIRGNVTVYADRLLARYRSQARPSETQAGAVRPAAAAGSPDQALGGGSNEIWRLEAEGNVRIVTETDTARGDRAVYDIDQAVLVLTGRGEVSLTTPSQVITAKDSLEYWSARKMAVARGNAVVVDNAEGGRRIAADTLVSYMLDGPGQANATPAPPPVAAKPGEKPVPGQGKVDRVEAFGNVEIRTATDVVRGDRGVYSAQTGMARLLGNVRITRTDNQINGQEAIVNLRTNVARLVSAPGARVQGLIMPNQDADQPGSDRTPSRGASPQPATPERRSR